MTTPIETTTAGAFLQDLLRHGHFLPSGEPGIYGRGEVFEDVLRRVEGLITRMGMADQAEKLRFPPVIPKRTLERAGYLKSFPQLCGSVFGFAGNPSAALAMAEQATRGEDWGAYLSMTDVVLVPAACYPAYPAIALRGPLPERGATLDLGGCYVFRNEPSEDPARLPMFHQRELVRIGETGEVLEWRETWMDRARRLFKQIGLQAEVAPAADPFFGRGGKLLANSQNEQGLKFEALIPISSPASTAVASFNYHRDHFGSAFGIQLSDGKAARSACVGFGLERITLALFRAHGMDAGDWPAEVRTQIWPDHAAPEK
jgi:seryl-tRNA synthetase